MDEWIECELWRVLAVQRYQDTPGQIAARVRDLAATPWRDYGRVSAR